MNELLYGDIANRIEQKIMTKEFEVTHKLPSEREMALQFDVSRNVVREAIKLLRAKGLVEIKPGKGVYVTKPKEEIVTETFKRVLKSNEVTKMDILDVREELEIIIIKKAVAKATKDCIKKLNRIYEEMDKRKHNVFSFIEKDAEFHLDLAKSTQNNVFYVLIHSFFFSY